MKSKLGIALVAVALVVIIGTVVAAKRSASPAPSPASAIASASASPPTASPANAWFEDRAKAAGIDFQLGHGGKTPLTVLETMGAGCAILDYDGDGKMDIFLVGQEKLGNTGKCALYRNNGDGTFRNTTAGSGLEAPGLYMGCAVADVDNDGKPDILVTGYGVVRLYRNAGEGKFLEVTKGSALESPSPTSWATSALFFDYDCDGLLDVYVGRYVVFDEHSLQLCDYGALKSSCGPMFYDAQLGSLYKNMGGFRFKDLTKETGLSATHGKCLGLSAADVNGDDWPDLYIGNDEMPGDLFINERGKKFHEVGLSSGLALASDGKFQGAMGVDFADYNRDGLFDLMVSTFEFEPSSLYAGTSSGVYENSSLATGIDQATRKKVGFGTKFLDVDNDGWLDIAVANGHIHDNQDLIDRMSHYRQPLQLFMSEESGKRFIDRASEAGAGFTTPCVGRGLVVGDLNDDGKLDIVVSDLEGQTRVLFNKTPKSGNWLRVALEGTKSNRMGIGARVTLVSGKKRWIAECTTGGSYLSASDPRVHFGLGTVANVDSVEVEWPSGRKSVVRNPKVSSQVHVREQ